MKKIIFSVCIIFSFYACSSETDSLNEISLQSSEKTTKINPEVDCVHNQMLLLNNTMFSDYNETRGIRGFFKRFFAIVLSDAIGGMFGSLLGPCGTAAGAILASSHAAVVPSNDIHIGANHSQTMYNFSPMNSYDVALTNVVPISGQTLVSKDDSIGFYHNLILLDLDKQFAGQTFTLDSVISKTAKYTAEIYNRDYKEIKVELSTNTNLYKQITSKEMSVENFDTIHDFIDCWQKLYPEKKDELTLLETYFNGLINIKVGENDCEYLSKVLDIISKSNLDSTMKDNLRNAFIVGNASYQLWNARNN